MPNGVKTLGGAVRGGLSLKEARKNHKSQVDLKKKILSLSLQEKLELGERETSETKKTKEQRISRC